MTRRGSITRRRWLLVMASGLGSLAGSTLGLFSFQRTSRPGGRLIRSAVIVGRAYLEKTPAEHDREVLSALLARAVGLSHAEFSNLGHEERCRRIRSAIPRDFEREDTVQLGGWVLSRTEVRMSAYLALG